MNAGLIAPRLMAWGMTAAGLGLGLIAAAFVGEYTPILILWGAALLGAGAALGAASYLIRNRRSG